jgi:hypothetical protein
MDAANEFWHVVEKLPNESSLGRYHDRKFSPVAYGHIFHSDGTAEYLDVPTRVELSAKYSWAIPSPQTLRWILDRLEGRGIVEMGAGTGYWAQMLSLGGADVVAYDQAPPDQTPNWFHSEQEEFPSEVSQEDVDAYHAKWGWLLEQPVDGIPLPEAPVIGDMVVTSRLVPDALREIYFPVQMGSVEKLADHPDRVLLLCWPPYNSTFAHDALQAYPGDTLIFIGEGPGGCTGDDSFFELLAAEWEEVEDQFTDFVAWYGLNDYVTLYRRKA